MFDINYVNNILLCCIFLYVTIDTRALIGNDRADVTYTINSPTNTTNKKKRKTIIVANKQ